ncbi:MAG: TonB-dependent receptor [Candidatus Acidiferrum sp.]
MNCVSSFCSLNLARAVRKFSILHFVVLALLLFGVAFLTTAQEATIVGTVTDPSGGVVPNVTITITNVKTGLLRTLTTNDVGQYVAPGLPIGTYDLKAEASGFKLEETKGIVLNVNDRIRIDFQMKMGTKAETVSVESNVVQVQSDSSEVSSLSSGTQMSELSTNGRSIYTYVALTPGANNLMPSFQAPTSVSASANISFNGNRPGHNLYLLDGGENYDRGSGGTSSIAPSIDAIAETQTLTSNYSAEYGLSSGGTVSSAVKSGTKDFHFSLWEFFRNDALDARNYFNPAPQAVGELRYNLYGFNAGGPVTFGKLYNPNKNKTFFFYNMEWRSLITAGSPINQPVPQTAFYGGDFSTAGYSLAQLHAPAVCQVSAAIQAEFAAAGQALSGCTAGAPDATKEVPFNGNVIPASLLNANAQALLTAGGKYGGIFPAPTNGSNFQAPVAAPTNVREEIARVDENVTDKLTIFGHFVAEQVAQNYTTTMWSSDNVPSVGNTFGNPSYAAVVHAAYVINPSLVNEVAFGYNGNRIHILPSGLYNAPSDYTFNRYFDGPNQDNRIPTIQLGGSTGTYYTANWTPWNNDANSYQWRDDLSWTKGRHQFKIGGDYLWYTKAQDWFQTTQGQYNFNGFYTGNDFADFLLGYANSYSEDAVKETGQWNSKSIGLYFQDNWRVNNRLTLNLGLRWDGIPHTYEANSVMSNFYPNLYSAADTAILNPGNQSINPASPGLTTSPNPILASLPLYTNGEVVCGQDGTPQGCVKGAWFNFGPRLGFAYDLTGKGRTVIRGGYAIMYERIQGNDMYDMAGNVPFAAGVSFPNVLLSNPGTSVLTNTTVTAEPPISSIQGMLNNEYAAPRSTQFSLGVQQAIGASSVLSISYVGSQNRHQSYLSVIDLPPESLLPGMQTSSALANNYNAYLPYIGYHEINMAQNEANGDYNSLQFSFRGSALGRSLTYQVGYTYSHTNDPVNGTSNDFDLNNISNPYAGWKYDYGPSYFDIRNNFFTNFVYDIPLLKNSGNKFMKTTLGGWEVSGIVTAISGAPLNIGVTGDNVCSVVPNCSNRPNVTGPLSNPHTVNEWFDTAAFSMPAPGTWGDEPHNGVRGPGRQNWNISLFKNFMFNQERGTNLQFRAEFFNIWNHPQWIGDGVNGGISTNLGASNFGQVTSAYDPREIQLALKFTF